MSEKKEITYKPSEVYNKLKTVVEANDTIIKSGGIPVSVGISGIHGIGKSTVCKELAEDLGRGFFKLNLAQLTEPSELLGFYSKEYKVTKKDETLWITENLLPKFVDDGYKYTNENKTVPCPPDWVQGLKENSILCLDDFSRKINLEII